MRSTSETINHHGTDYEQLSIYTLFNVENEEKSKSQIPDTIKSVLDDVLRFGGNVDHHRLWLLSAFQEEKPEQEIEKLLPRLYRGGTGLMEGTRQYAVWFDPTEGVRIAKGEQAREIGAATTISWAETAQRLSELVANGMFSYPSETEEEVLAFVQKQTAERIWYLWVDIAGENRNKFFPSLSQITLYSFPESVKCLTGMIQNRESLELLYQDYIGFLKAYSEHREIMRFHYHKTDMIKALLENLLLPRVKIQDSILDAAEPAQFITQDELRQCIGISYPYSDTQEKIREAFVQLTNKKDKADFLKNHYGCGGRSHALSGASSSWMNYSSKGMSFRKAECPEVKLSWNKVADLYDLFYAMTK